MNEFTLLLLLKPYILSYNIMYHATQSTQTMSNINRNTMNGPAPNPRYSQRLWPGKLIIIWNDCEQLIVAIITTPDGNWILSCRTHRPPALSAIWEDWPTWSKTIVPLGTADADCWGVTTHYLVWGKMFCLEICSNTSCIFYTLGGL